MKTINMGKRIINMNRRIINMNRRIMNMNGRIMNMNGRMIIMNERMGNIGNVISALRKKKGLTQEELGNKTDLNRITIVKIENSQRAISLDEAVKIAKVFSIDVDTMYSYIQSNEEKSNEESFVIAFKAKGMNEENLKEIKRIELLVDALFTQQEIRGE